jgi:hypothetical protein
VTINVASSGGGGGTGGSYRLVYDPAGHANGQPLHGATVSGRGWVFVTPETGVARVDFFVNGQTWHTEVAAPYDIQGSTIFSFDQLRDGANTVTANVTTTGNQTVTVSATFQVGEGSTGGGGGGGSANDAPARPTLSLGGVVGLDEALLAGASAFSDPDGDAFAASEWQIARDDGFTDLVLSRSVNARAGLALTAGVLEPSQSYWVRTRHRDARGGVSEWSSAATITTAAALPGDANGNGTEDASEVFGFVDSNGNGTDDGEEGICNLLAAGGNIVGLESESGDVQCFRAVSDADAPAPPSAEMRFPFGLFSFRIEGLRIDPVEPARVTVSVHLPERPAGAVRWYKADPATGALFELPGAVTFQGSTALVELVDGGIGDFDGVVNGVIVDPSGPLTIPSSGGNGGSGGAVADDSGGGSSGWLVPALLAAVGLSRRRRASPARA